MSPALVVETQDFVDASRTMYDDVASPLASAAGRLVAAVDDCAAMAGTDPGGQRWASEYDRAASAAVRAMHYCVQSCGSLSSMFAQSALNYANADAASTAGARRAISSAVATLPPDTYYGAAPSLPSAAGGAGSPPAGWHLVAHWVGYVWPDGHQDKLRAAAAAWTASADVLSAHSFDATVAAIGFVRDSLPEADDMLTVCRGMTDHLNDVAGAQRSIARACEQLAHHIDEMHSEVEGELKSLLEWTAGIQAVGGLVSVFTLGAAEVPTQAVQTARIAATAARVGEIIARFVGLAKTAADTVVAVVARARDICTEVGALADAKLVAARLQVARRIHAVNEIGQLIATGRLAEFARPLSRLTLTLGQLEKKFKRARLFGVTASRGREGFEAFKARLDAFLADPETVRTPGTYRGQPAILSYNPHTRLVVIQSLDGKLVSGWRMTEYQLREVLTKRRIGLG